MAPKPAAPPPAASAAARCASASRSSPSAGERAQQGGLVGEMAVERGGADAHRARHLAQAEIVGGALLEQLQPASIAAARKSPW